MQKNQKNRPRVLIALNSANNIDSNMRPAGVLLEKLRLFTLRKLNDFDSMYLPFAKLENCNVGNQRKKDASFVANKEKKDMILPYIAAWSMRGFVMGLGLELTERLHLLGYETIYLQLFFALCLCGCAIISIVLFVGWLGLTRFKE